MGHDNEASVEEILESIKKVIARDNRAVALENRRRRDVAPERPVEITPMLAPEAPRDMEFVSETEVPALPLANDDETPLIDDTVRSAMQDNLAALAMLAEPGAKPQIVRSGETSLEGLTRELLRPMLAEWLEANLPAMVEQMVQAEIARIVGKKV
jgi:cell pole-organizing protein PopZ